MDADADFHDGQSIAVFCGFQVQAEALVRMSELN